ncbi:MAG: phosphatase [Gammaproteobacteria bacterium]|nr:phosphatase [Gammaproteobacteria bacterium]
MRQLTDTHAHTVASTHAFSTVDEYFRAAKAKGLHLFSITDHGPEMPDSPHPWHFGNMRVLPRVRDGVAMLRGIEANIVPDARIIDANETLLSFMDFAIASFHEPVFPPSDRLTHTKAMIAAIASGRVQIIGHPGNPNYPIEIDAVVRACVAHGVALEINNSSFHVSRHGSEPHCMAILEACAREGAFVAAASDAHVAYAVGDVETSLEKIQAAQILPDAVVTLTAQRLLAFLEQHGRPVASDLRPWLVSLEKKLGA